MRLKGMGKRCNEQLLEELKTEIEIKREKLNSLVIGEVSKEEVLKFSIELDELIHKYYKYSNAKNEQ